MCNSALKWVTAITTARHPAFGFPAKSGSSSIRQAIENEGLQWMITDPLNHGERVFVVRHPLDRFKSLWRNKCRDGGKIIKNKKSQEQHPLKGMSPAELLVYILGWSNHHWMPQTKLLGNVVPTTIVRLEDFPEYWRQYGETPFPKSHATSGDCPLDVDTYDGIMRYYAADVKLWEDAR